MGNVQQQFRLTKDFLLTSGLEKQLHKIIESYYKNVIQVIHLQLKLTAMFIENVSGVCYLEFY